MKKLFLRLFSYVTGRAAQDITAAVELVKDALPLVRTIAALTPTRADDELVKLFDHFAMPQVNAWLALSANQRGRALLHVASTQLKRITPDSADRIIDLAVQLAVVQMRAEEK
jgi:acyl carrier protein phosphodiesterase